MSDLEVPVYLRRNDQHRTYDEYVLQVADVSDDAAQN